MALALSAEKKMDRRLLLASASERRRKILAGLGVGFEVAIPEVEEIVMDGDPRGTAAANAARKMEWCRTRYRGRYVITADTLVDLDGQIVGKPSSLEDAAIMLRAFSGRPQNVLTAVGFATPDARPEIEVVVSTVVFKTLSDKTIRKYFARVNPMDKAGAYDIDQCGELLIRSFEGSRSNIMGLPRETVRTWLIRVGLL